MKLLCVVIRNIVVFYQASVFQQRVVHVHHFFWSLDPVGINIYKSVGDPISYRFLVPIIVSATSCMMMMHAKDHFIMMIIVSKATVLHSLNRKKFSITNN